MNKTLLLGTGVVSLAVAGLIAFGAASTSAQGQYGNGGGQGYERALDDKAKVLNMDREQLQTQLKDKTMLQVVEDQGLTQEQFQEKMKQAAEARWKERGLSEEQIKERQERMEERHANCDGEGGGEHRYGRS